MTLVIDPIIYVANLSTVLLGAFNKVPQILSVTGAKSPAGVSMRSVMIELTGYMITMSYFMANHYTLWSYLEYPALVLQDITLLLAVLWFGGQEFSPVVVGGYFCGLVCLNLLMTSSLLSATVMSLLVGSGTPISAMSKIVFIRSIIARGSSEGVALSSCCISAYTCMTRVLTVYVESTDAALLINFGVSLCLNLAVVATVLKYKPSKEQVEAKKEE